MKARLLDKFEGRIRLEGILTTRTGLHIGAGGSGDPLATDSPVVRNAGNNPFIPGSSLKGVIRSAAESLLRGVDAGRKDRGKLWSCDQIGGECCVSHKEIEGIRKKHERVVDGRTEVVEKLVAEEIWEASCPVCRIFGSMALASRVRFPDLPLLGSAPLTEIRNGVGIERDKELAAKGVLYDFEAVPPETKFGLTVIADNADDWEVGLVLFLFEELSNGSLAIGGKTSRGLGQVRIDWQRIIETTLGKPGGMTNPFAGLLSKKELLAIDEPAEVADETPTEPPVQELPLPESGTRDNWQALAELLLAMPEIDKSALGQRTSEIGLNKGNVNEKLGLGLEGRVRKVWDIVLDHLVDSGFLDKQDDTYAVAGRQPAEEDPEGGVAEPEQEVREPALQATYDRFIGKVKELWDEEVL
jgi:CRISPR-associated RAMP protein (TIGR02581 family)